MNAELEATRAQLALVERELLELGARHDLAMSAFRFDEARDLQQRITLFEHERAELRAMLPTAAPPPADTPVRIGLERGPVARRRGLPTR